MITDTLLLSKKDELVALAEACGVQSIKLFGSRGRGDARSDSDIDLLVRYDESNKSLSPLTFDVRVRALFPQAVDIVNEKNIYWYLREPILRDARLLWSKTD